MDLRAQTCGADPRARDLRARGPRIHHPLTERRDGRAVPDAPRHFRDPTYFALRPLTAK